MRKHTPIRDKGQSDVNTGNPGVSYALSDKERSCLSVNGLELRSIMPPAIGILLRHRVAAKIFVLQPFLSPKQGYQRCFDGNCIFFGKNREESLAAVKYGVMIAARPKEGWHQDPHDADFLI